MAGKYTFYAQLAEETAGRITASREAWKGFLTTSARLYKYPYEDQLMIYAQRPDATACAEYDLWNERMHRYVKRGSRESRCSITGAIFRGSAMSLMCQTPGRGGIHGMSSSGRYRTDTATVLHKSLPMLLKPGMVAWNP